MCFTSGELRSPGDHVLASGEVKERLLSGQCDSGSSGHGVGPDFSCGELQRPRRVLNLAAKETAAVIGGVEAVAFGKKVFEHAGPGMEGSADRTIRAVKLRGRGCRVGAGAAIFDLCIAAVADHVSTKIGKVKCCAGDCNGDGIRSVETEEPDTGLVA